MQPIYPIKQPLLYVCIPLSLFTVVDAMQHQSIEIESVDSFVQKLCQCIELQFEAEFGAVIFDLYDAHGINTFFTNNQKRLLINKTKSVSNENFRFLHFVNEITGEITINRYKLAHEKDLNRSLDSKNAHGQYKQTLKSLSYRGTGFVPTGALLKDFKQIKEEMLAATQKFHRLIINTSFIAATTTITAYGIGRILRYYLSPGRLK